MHPFSASDRTRTETVSVIMPCLDEEAALPIVLAAIPEGWQAVVVDNGSTDASAATATALGARVITESRRGYGAAVHAGLLAADTDLVAVIDGDGSVDPGELTALVDLVRNGHADLVCGRRYPVGSGAWPWHARAGNGLLAMIIRIFAGVDVHDIAPVRIARRQKLVGLGVADRRCGYPLETLLAARRAGWRVVERPVTYRPRVEGTRSKITGTVRGTMIVLMDFTKTLIRSAR